MRSSPATTRPRWRLPTARTTRGPGPRGAAARAPRQRQGLARDRGPSYRLRLARPGRTTCLRAMRPSSGGCGPRAPSSSARPRAGVHLVVRDGERRCTGERATRSTPAGRAVARAGARRRCSAPTRRSSGSAPTAAARSACPATTAASSVSAHRGSRARDRVLALDPRHRHARPERRRADGQVRRGSRAAAPGARRARRRRPVRAGRPAGRSGRRRVSKASASGSTLMTACGP